MKKAKTKGMGERLAEIHRELAGVAGQVSLTIEQKRLLRTTVKNVWLPRLNGVIEKLEKISEEAI